MTVKSQRLVFQATSTFARLAGAMLAAALGFFLAFPLELELRGLLAWDLALVSYLALLAIRMTAADAEDTRVLAEQKETANAFILTLAAILSGCNLAGVGLLLHRSQDWTPLMANLHLGLSLLAVFLSWTLLHALFGIHYAALYYDPTPPEGEPVDGSCLAFPDDVPPDFWDFMYFSFTIAVCYQVSDVTIRSRHVRRLTLAHVLLSFLNVTMILGLVVEIVSTLVGTAGRGV